MNKCIFTGRLCADPEFRQTQSGVAVCRFRIAVNRPYSKDKEQKADFINCTAWRNTAEFISRYFSKGSAIIVEGSLHNSDYTDQNGVKHYGMDVQVSNVEFGESKKSGENSNATYQPAAPQQQYSQPNQQSPVQYNNAPGVVDLNEFEEILSDGEVPF